MRGQAFVFITVVLILITAQAPAAGVDLGRWMDSVQELQQQAAAEQHEKVTKEDRAIWLDLAKEHPILTDWLMQDMGGWERVLKQLWRGADAPFFNHLLEGLGQGVPLNVEDRAFNPEAGWKRYIQACEQRRQQRLAPLMQQWPRLVFTKHYDLGGSHYAYTEGQSDAQRERTFQAGSSLCILNLNTIYGEMETLIKDPGGVIRDPDVSYDGNTILFAWKKALDNDDYHLYDYDVASGTVRPLTEGLGFADYEGAYLPNGDIIFNSTRCVQTVDCWWTEVSNLYACDKDGNYMRRLSFDQVHTNFPTVTHDGRVIYTRWDYNDRGQIYPQPLFQMNPDGTAQTALYGNNSWFPTAILHARSIPNSPKFIAVLSGHHSHQRGKLAIIDPRKGREENSGVQLIAPVRKTPAVKVDAYGQNGDQFQYPYALDETHFLVTYTPYAAKNREYVLPYGIYFMDSDGHRELLAFDPAISCNQSIPLVPRKRPHQRPSAVDYTKDAGVYYVQDVYAGFGLAGVKRGTVKSLRVIALEFRAAGIGDNRNHGEAGGALVSTPIAAGNGAWDVKRVLGDAPVHADGSAMFIVPARTPVYFQAIDQQGHTVQTMRSWSTLQPGERFSCVGCHEDKNETPVQGDAITRAMQAGPQPLNEFYGPARGFSFRKEIQPILDKHCVQCHDNRDLKPKQESLTQVVDSEVKKAFSLLDTPRHDPGAKRHWNDAYLNLLNAEFEKKHSYTGRPNHWIQWMGAQTAPAMLPPYYSGASKSALMPLLDAGHGGVKLTREERDKIACWIDLNVPYCGDYIEANAWTEEEKAIYARFEEKRRRMAEKEWQNILSMHKATP